MGSSSHHRDQARGPPGQPAAEIGEPIAPEREDLDDTTLRSDTDLAPHTSNSTNNVTTQLENRKLTVGTNMVKNSTIDHSTSAQQMRATFLPSLATTTDKRSSSCGSDNASRVRDRMSYLSVVFFIFSAQRMLESTCFHWCDYQRN